MRGDLILSTGTLIGFLLTLVRIGGILVFVPLPGMTAVLSPARVIMTLGLSIALFPLWPQVAAEPSASQLTLWILSEAALGLGIGLAVAFVTEAFTFAAQIMGLQAGYAFASTFDPNTQADSTVLVIFAQLAAGMMFFASGLDREVIRVFARSLETYPAGSFVLSHGPAEEILAIGSAMFSTGLRLALPIVAVLVMIDISLALLGRVNAQIQLLTIAFPVKMIVGLALLGWLMLLMPTLFRAMAGRSFEAVHHLITR
jgi:flagellar biosynthesis protein FliR